MVRMVAIAESSRCHRRARTCLRAGSASCARRSNSTTRIHRNQQYSITALTDGTASVVERCAYTAYGQPTFADGSGTVLTASAEANRYTYTGREWDEGLGLYHFRARMYAAAEGRFLSRDPISFASGSDNEYEYVDNGPTSFVDPSGNAKAGTLFGIPVGIEKHHWFMKFHRHRTKGYGQGLVSNLCGTLVDIDDYTTPYTAGEHKWLHNPKPRSSSPYGCKTLLKYKTVYMQTLRSSNSCCDLLQRMYGLMMAYHTALQGAHGTGIIPGIDPLFGSLIPPYLHVGPPSPFVLVPWKGKPKNTRPKFFSAMTKACGNDPDEDQKIKLHYNRYLEWINSHSGVLNPSDPGFTIPIIGIPLPAPMAPPVQVPLPAAG